MEWNPFNSGYKLRPEDVNYNRALCTDFYNVSHAKKGLYSIGEQVIMIVEWRRKATDFRDRVYETYFLTNTEYESDGSWELETTADENKNEKRKKGNRKKSKRKSYCRVKGLQLPRKKGARRAPTKH